MISSAKKDFISVQSHLCTMSSTDYMGAWEKFKFKLCDCFSGSCCRMETFVIVEEKNPSGFSFDLVVSVYDVEVVVVPC